MRESELKKRSNSWKGKAKPFLDGFEYDEWDDAVKGRGGANSRQQKRRNMNKKVAKEHHDFGGHVAPEREEDESFDDQNEGEGTK